MRWGGGAGIRCGCTGVYEAVQPDHKAKHVEKMSKCIIIHMIRRYLSLLLEVAPQREGMGGRHYHHHVMQHAVNSLQM